MPRSAGRSRIRWTSSTSAVTGIQDRQPLGRTREGPVDRADPRRVDRFAPRLGPLVRRSALSAGLAARVRLGSRILQQAEAEARRRDLCQRLRPHDQLSRRPTSTNGHGWTEFRANPQRPGRRQPDLSQQEPGLKEPLRQLGVTVDVLVQEIAEAARAGRRSRPGGRNARSHMKSPSWTSTQSLFRR